MIAVIKLAYDFVICLPQYDGAKLLSLIAAGHRVEEKYVSGGCIYLPVAESAQIEMKIVGDDKLVLDDNSESLRDVVMRLEKEYSEANLARWKAEKELKEIQSRETSCVPETPTPPSGNPVPTPDEPVIF